MCEKRGGREDTELAVFPKRGTCEGEDDVDGLTDFCRPPNGYLGGDDGFGSERLVAIETGKKDEDDEDTCDAAAAAAARCC